MRALACLGLIALTGCARATAPTDAAAGFDVEATSMDAGPPIAVLPDGSTPASPSDVVWADSTPPRDSGTLPDAAVAPRDAAGPFELEPCEGVPALEFGRLPVDGGHDWGRAVTTVVNGALRDIEVQADLRGCGSTGRVGATVAASWKLDVGNIPGRVLCARLARVELETPENYLAIRVGLTPASGGSVLDGGVTLPQSTFGSYHEAHEICPWNCFFTRARISVLVETEGGAAVVTGAAMASCRL